MALQGRIARDPGATAIGVPLPFPEGGFVLEGLQQLLAAALGRAAAIGRYRHQHDCVSRQHQTDPMSHQHCTRPVPASGGRADLPRISTRKPRMALAQEKAIQAKVVPKGICPK